MSEYDHDFPSDPRIQRMQEAYARMRDLLEVIDLPPRGKIGSRVNQLRAKIERAAIHQLKVAGSGVCQIRRRRGRCVLCKTPVPYKTSDRTGS
jgi:hypothetical protein